MAEGFANHYGKDVLIAASAGLMPIPAIDPRTVLVMEERGVDVSSHVPSRYDARSGGFDFVVNLSGVPVEPPAGAKLIDWKVRDPYNSNLDFYREIRDEIDRLVMLFILEQRRLRSQVAV
jgi:protein-tyrosine-phosphatase